MLSKLNKSLVSISNEPKSKLISSKLKLNLASSPISFTILLIVETLSLKLEILSTFI